MGAPDSGGPRWTPGELGGQHLTRLTGTHWAGELHSYPQKTGIWNGNSQNKNKWLTIANF